MRRGKASGGNSSGPCLVAAGLLTVRTEQGVPRLGESGGATMEPSCAEHGWSLAADEFRKASALKELAERVWSAGVISPGRTPKGGQIACFPSRQKLVSRFG